MDKQHAQGTGLNSPWFTRAYAPPPRTSKRKATTRKPTKAHAPARAQAPTQPRQPERIALCESCGNPVIYEGKHHYTAHQCERCNARWYKAHTCPAEDNFATQAMEDEENRREW